MLNRIKQNKSKHDNFYFYFPQIGICNSTLSHFNYCLTQSLTGHGPHYHPWKAQWANNHGPRPYHVSSSFSPQKRWTLFTLFSTSFLLPCFNRRSRRSSLLFTDLRLKLLYILLQPSAFFP